MVRLLVQPRTLQMESQMQGSKAIERTVRTRTKNVERVEKARAAKRMEKRATKERAEDRRAAHA